MKTMQIITHYNKVLSVILNKDNTSIHLPCIRKMIENFEATFPESYGAIKSLTIEFCELQNRVL